MVRKQLDHHDFLARLCHDFASGTRVRAVLGKKQSFFCIQNGGFTMKNIGFTMTNLGLNCLNIKLNGGLTFVIFICSAPNCWYHQQTMEDMEIW